MVAVPTDGDNMLYEYYTSFTNSQLLIKDTEGNILKAIYGVGGDGKPNGDLSRPLYWNAALGFFAILSS